MPVRGIVGQIVEVRRSEGELHLDWRISGFLYLPRGGEDSYVSLPFGFHDARWHLEVWPDWLSPGGVFLHLHRDDDGGPSTRRVIISGGVRGSGGGVERSIRETERKFQKSGGCNLGIICKRSELLKQKDLLVPGGTLTFVCQMKVTGTAATGVLSRPPPSDSAIKEPVAPANRSQPSDKRGVLSRPPPSDSTINRSQPSDKRELPSDVLVTYSYKELQTATQDFGDLPLRAGGCKIGEGGFGTVYRAVVKGDVVAVKRLKNALDPQFITELKTLTNYKHKNLVPLLGFSLGDKCCLLYEYMPNGSLEDRLACNDGSEPLSWQTRLSISHGSALGINHLHMFGKEPEVHRDIKSANILLDLNFVPKVGDFGLVRTGSSGGATTMPVTQRCIGTPGYMPREAYEGDVSVKWDTFSFGVVLLELLTGLPPYDPNRRCKYLITHMENCKDILCRLDPKAKWNQKAATDLYRITQRCLEQSKRSRPYFSEILEDLKKLSLLR